MRWAYLRWGARNIHYYYEPNLWCFWQTEFYDQHPRQDRIRTQISRASIWNRTWPRASNLRFAKRTEDASEAGVALSPQQQGAADKAHSFANKFADEWISKSPRLPLKRGFRAIWSPLAQWILDYSVWCGSDQLDLANQHVRDNITRERPDWPPCRFGPQAKTQQQSERRVDFEQIVQNKSWRTSIC